MKTLNLIRHAKSSWKQLELRDFDRPLKKRGHKDSRLIADWLLQNEIQFDHILCSSAKRARQTAEIITQALHIPAKKLHCTKAIYMAYGDDLLKLLQKQDDRHQSLALFGHNPEFTLLLNQLCQTNIENLPTAGVAGIRFPLKTWQALEYGKGELIYFVRPKELRD